VLHMHITFFVSIKSLRIGFVGLVLCAASALAGPSAIQGIVKDAKGQAIKGADVRIESRDGSKLFKTVKTDANGHYTSDGLPAGVYRATLVVNGAVKASISNTKTKADGPTQLNFDLKPVSAAQASATAKSGKHMVWVPAGTGTHIGGRWVEVPDTGSAEPGALKVKRANEKDLEREAHSMTGGLPPAASGSTTGP
jgi:Carboxypeptidase regulatory-like domain